MTLRDLIRSTRPTGPLFSVRGRRFGFLMDAPDDLDSVERLLQKLEADGASAEALSEALMNAYHHQFPIFRGLSTGFRRREELVSTDPRMGLWALTVFRDGWRVLEPLGTTPEILLRYLLNCWPPEAWLAEGDLLQIPEELGSHLEPGRMVFGPEVQPVDLRWLGQRLACGLSIAGSVPGLRLPESLTCRGYVRLEGIHGLKTLRSLTAPGNRLIVKNCPDLEELHVPDATALEVWDCPKLTRIGGEVAADIQVEDCAALVQLDVVMPRDATRPPSLIIRRCTSLVSVGRFSGVPRVCQNMVLEDCPKLERVDPRIIVRWERRVAGCPALKDGKA